MEASAANVMDVDYKVSTYVNAARSFDRSIHKCVWIIDYFGKRFPYVSGNLAYWCGRRSGGLGYRLYFDCVPDDERGMLSEINRKAFEFFDGIPVEHRTEYSITYDFNLMSGNRRRLVNFCLTPMTLTPNGGIWLALCTLSMSASSTPGNVVMRRHGSKSYWEYSLRTHKWTNRKAMTLSDMEKDVLILSAQGYTMKEMSDRLFKSIDTIKSCKRALFAKLGVKKITEALAYATSYNLI